MLVIENGNSEPAAVFWINEEVELSEVVESVDGVHRSSRAVRIEPPSFLPHMIVHNVDRNDILEAFELAHNKSAMRPGARVGHVQVVPSSFRGESAAPVLCHPVPVAARFALELARFVIRPFENGRSLLRFFLHPVRWLPRVHAPLDEC